MSLPAVLYSARALLELKVEGEAAGSPRHQVCRQGGRAKEEKRSSKQMNELRSTGHVIRGARACAGSITVCVCRDQT